MNRGDHREPIFRSNKDREVFLATLGQTCEKTDWQVHAWCLMRNHFHLKGVAHFATFLTCIDIACNNTPAWLESCEFNTQGPFTTS